MARRLSRGDIHLVRFPSPDKERPALILTRDAVLPALTRIMVAPITSTIRGIPGELLLTADDGMKQVCAVNLFSVTTVARASIGRHLLTLNEFRMAEICGALAFALGCD